MWRWFPSVLPMQLRILQMLLNSSAIRSHSSEIGTAINIICSIFQMALPHSRTMPFIAFFPTRKEYPKDANESPMVRYLKHFFFRFPQKCKEQWHNLRRKCIREKRKSKEKISGSGATVKGKWPNYIMIFWTNICSVKLRLEMFRGHNFSWSFIHWPRAN